MTNHSGDADDGVERERFEAWARRSDAHSIITTLEDDVYVHRDARLAWAAWQARAQSAKDIVGWRLRIGDSDLWSYCDSESDADFHGNASGMRYVKEPLSISQSSTQDDGLLGELASSELENARLTQLATDYGRKAYALEAALAAGRITQAIYDESIALASSFHETSKREDRHLCPNCDTYLPKGCGGSFINQRECMLNFREDMRKNHGL